MRRRARLALAMAALGAAPSLSGCVAAALPVLAATGVLGTQVGGDKGKDAARGEPRVSVDLAPMAPSAGSRTATPVAHSPGPALVRNYTLDDGTRMEVMTGPLPAPSPASSTAHPQTQGAVLPAAQVAAQASAPVGEDLAIEDGTRLRLVSGPLPAPTGASAAPAGFAGYDGLYGYVARLGALPAAGSERPSALLADPGTLAPATRECSIHPAAVLVDLDPGASILDPATAVHGDPALAGRLAALRDQGIAIAWISGNTADRAGAVRRALVASGLDPAGRDELALLRYPEERKQTRRQDLGREYCVVAIAGDERGDFDELFQYLKNPALAGPLDRLIGAGWFLIPQPLS